MLPKFVRAPHAFVRRSELVLLFLCAQRARARIPYGAAARRAAPPTVTHFPRLPGDREGCARQPSRANLIEINNCTQSERASESRTSRRTREC